MPPCNKCRIFAQFKIKTNMKIYYETDCSDECITKCPWKGNCMVGSLYCLYHCHHFGGGNICNDTISMFSVNGEISCRNANYVDCKNMEGHSLKSVIKRLLFRYSN